MAEVGRPRTKGWLRTVRNIVVLEGYPHLAGLFGALTLDNIVPVHSTQALAGGAVGVNGAMWFLMYGPNTRKNVNYLADTGASISIGAKVIDQFAARRGQPARVRRNQVTLAHRIDLTFWEVIYGIEALTIGTTFGTDAALRYWGSAGLYGLLKNIALLGIFQGREGARTIFRNSNRKPAAPKTVDGDPDYRERRQQP
jgi:hypothetical protein